MSETHLSKSIRDALALAGFWVIRLQSSGRRGARSVATGEPGLPDLYLPGLGHLEVKTKLGKESAAQRIWSTRAVYCGVRVATVRDPAEAVRVAAAWRTDWQEKHPGERYDAWGRSRSVEKAKRAGRGSG